MDSFSWDAHARFFLRSLLKPGLPKQYTKADTQRMTLVYFCVTGLDLLGKLDNLSGSDNTAVKKWILSRQIRSMDVSETGWRRCGFRGGPFDGDPFGFGEVRCPSISRECPEAVVPGAKQPESVVSEGNLAMTYSALASLAALGDSFSDVDVGAILRALRTLQHQDGSFQASVSDPTCDLRFLYCACAVSSILKNWDGVDRGKAVAYIERCYDFDGGIGMAPGREACAGPTYCAVASMELMGVLDKLDPARRERLVEWCVKRQEDGFQSRPNKLADSCCSFWIGATLALLGRLPLVDRAQARRFHISCQSKVLGGFAKVPGTPPDLLHAFYSASWLSLAEEPGVEEMNVSLGITKRARALLLL